MIIDKELMERYKSFTDNVMQCYSLIIAGQPADYDRIMDLLALTSGQATGIAYYMGVSVPKPRPWEAIGVSRSTYYNDLKRARAADKRNNINKILDDGS
jgi:hypothetical protein